MAINFDQRLKSLQARRSLPREIALDEARMASKALAFAEPPPFVEAYQTRGKTQGQQYALGVMQAVDPKVTEVSYREGERVKNQLEVGLPPRGELAEFEYQGSVPLNIHIEFSSDIDLLVLKKGILGVDWTGPRASSYTRREESKVEVLIGLRGVCAQILDEKYPQAKVDTTGDKSISISGGSLRRKVDVVPSLWYDNADYQQQPLKYLRSVEILDMGKRATFINHPFLHMQRIEEKDLQTRSGAKKVIRMLKSLIRDSERPFALKSYDIAGLVWHFPEALLSVPGHQELLLVHNTHAMLTSLASQQASTMALLTPDRTRNVIDSQEKFQALADLLKLVDELLASIYKEGNPYGYYTPSAARDQLFKLAV